MAAVFKKELQKYPKVSGDNVRVYLSSELGNTLNIAAKEAQQLKDDYVSTEHLLIALSESKSKTGEILKRSGITKQKVYQALVEIRGSQRVSDQNPEDKYQALQRFGKDVTELARKGRLDPVIGRDDEIRRVIQVLSRRTKNNPVLIGEPGVGKTAIVEGLAQRIVSVSYTHLDVYKRQDYDNRIMNYLADEFKKEQGIDLRLDRQALQRLIEASEKAKIELSSVMETNVSLPFITADANGPKHLETKITRAKFEQLSADLTERCRIPMEKALADSGLKISDIDEVILVGGATRMPVIQELVKKIINKDVYKRQR